MLEIEENELYETIIKLFEEKQIDMILEEGGELIKEIANLIIHISKMRRAYPKGKTLDTRELIWEFAKTPSILQALGGEIADLRIVLKQFYREFDLVIERNHEYKLDRLKKKIEFAKKNES